MSLEEKVLDDVAELFPHKPGGLIDRARKEEAARKAAIKQVEEEVADKIEDRAYRAVKVADEMPEDASAHTYVVSDASGVQQLLGQDMLRRRATILTLDQPVVIASSLAEASDTNNPAAGSAAVSASGFVLPVNVPLILETRHEIWVTPTSATATRVSVLTEAYAPGA